MNKTVLWSELLLIFIGLPLMVLSGLLPKSAIMPMLWVAALYAYFYLRSSGVKIWALDFERAALYTVLARFIFIAALITLYTLLYRPALFLSLPRNAPYLWLEVIVLYPLISAFAQEVLFRSFFFTRYKKLFKSRQREKLEKNLI